MKKTIKALACLTLGLFLAVNVVAEAPLTGDTTTVVTQKVKPGTLSLQSPGDVVMPEITASTVNQTLQASASNWVVDDARGKKSSEQPGWSLTVSATDFSDGAGSNIPVTNLSVVPANLAIISGNTDEVSLGTNHTFSSGSDQTTVAAASTGKGKGRFSGDLDLSLVVPANSDAADYTSTMTFTVQ